MIFNFAYNINIYITIKCKLFKKLKPEEDFKMLKSKKAFLFLFLIAGFLFLFGNVKKASAQNGIFISTLSHIHGYKINKDYGIGSNAYFFSSNSYSAKKTMTAIFKNINKSAPQNSNACINFKLFAPGKFFFIGYCEYVKIVPVQK